MARDPIRSGEVSALGQHACRLDDVERDALGSRVELRGELGWGGSAELVRQKACDLSARERAEADLVTIRLLAQQRDGSMKRIARRAWLVAKRRRDEERGIADLALDMLEQLQRRRARPVQVLEHEEEGSALRARAQGSGRRVEEQEPALIGGQALRGRLGNGRRAG